jgi:nucleoside-diphosphate-sugar epimerase
MRTVITGGAGFIGSALARALLQQGNTDDEIILIDSLDRHGETEALNNLRQSKSIQFIQADLTDPSSLCSLPNPDRVFNLAGMVGVGNVIAAPARVMWTNTSIAANVLHWFVEAGAPGARLLYASTSEVYAGNVLSGFGLPIPTPENVPAVIHDPASPRMSYGVSKLWGEMYGRFVAQSTGKFVASVRYHNVYGPAMGDSHVIPQVISRVLRRETPFRIIGAEETRSFCWIDDAAEATRLVLEAEKLRAGEVVHIGDPKGEITIRELYDMIFDVLEWQPGEVVLESSNTASVSRRCPDTSFLESLIGSQPKTTLRAGLSRTAAWYREHLV